MARTDPSFNLRIPPSLKEKLEIEAKSSGRTITAEIIKRLDDSFGENKIKPSFKEIEELLEFVQGIKSLDLSRLKRGNPINLSDDDD